MKQSFLYILQHATDNRVKIGRSINPFSRARGLPDEIDLDRSLQMGVESRWVGKAERTLHFVAREFAVDIDHNGDGKTEWFSAEALPVVLAFVDSNPSVFGGATFLEISRIYAPSNQADLK